MNHLKFNQTSTLTAHGLGGVDLLANEELLQLPDVHTGLSHGHRVPAPLGGTTVLRGALTWAEGEIAGRSRNRGGAKALRAPPSGRRVLLL